MTDRALSANPAAADLDGTEKLWVYQGGGDKNASAAQIAKYFRDTANVTAANSNITLITNGDSKSVIMANLGGSSAIWWAIILNQLEIRATVSLGQGGTASGDDQPTGPLYGLITQHRLTQMKAAVAAAIAAGTTPIMILETGTNDRGGNVEGTLSNVRRYIAECKAAGAFKLILCTVDPRGYLDDGQGNAATHLNQQDAVGYVAINHGYRQIALNDPFVILADPSQLLIAPPTDPYNQYFCNFGYGLTAGYTPFYDGWLHEGVLGGYLKGKSIADALTPLCKRRLPFAQSKSDAWDGTTNPRGNILGAQGVFGGTGGTNAQDQTNGGTVVGIANFPAAVISNFLPQIGGNLHGLTVTIESVPWTPMADTRPDQRATRFTFSGTPTADATFSVIAFNQIAVPVGLAFLYEVDTYIHDLVGLLAFSADGAVSGPVIDMGLSDGTYLPKLDGRCLMYSPNPQIIQAGYGGVNKAEVKLAFAAGVPVSGSFELSSMALWTEPPLPAPSTASL